MKCACFALVDSLEFGDKRLKCAAKLLIIDLVGQLCMMSSVVELGLQNVFGLMISDSRPDVPMLSSVGGNSGRWSSEVQC